MTMSDFELRSNSIDWAKKIDLDVRIDFDLRSGTKNRLGFEN